MSRLDCWRVRRALPALTDRDGPADLALRRHLRDCPKCRREAGEYRALRSATGRVSVSATAMRSTAGVGRAKPARTAFHDDRGIVVSAVAGAALVAAVLGRRVVRVRRI